MSEKRKYIDENEGFFNSRNKKARCNAAIEMTRHSSVFVSSEMRRPRSAKNPPCTFSRIANFDEGALSRNSSLETTSSASLNRISSPFSSNQRHSLSSSNPDSGLCSLDLSDISLNGASRSDISRVRSSDDVTKRCLKEIGSRSTSALGSVTRHDVLPRPLSVSSMPNTSRHRSSKTFRNSVKMTRQSSATLPGWDVFPNPSNLPLPKIDKRIEELVHTEREYVKSLNYIVKHYIPEMDRADIPATLRGHRSTLFGNLAKLRDFHQNQLLPQLERSHQFAHRIAPIFLRHESELDMYAYYVKNKPLSDRLMAESGKFFAKKQEQIGDAMDLASYLLKPVQRLTKYALFLDGISKNLTKTADKEEIDKAKKLIEFQLRHGNDLLAMDMIRGCDVDLRSCGKLLRQHEFIITIGRRKAQRRIFLFEKVCLFAKTKKLPSGDIYQYKNSWLTSEIGMTPVLEEPLKFELWHRRRNRETVNYCASQFGDRKEQWINEINALLLSQAAQIRDARMKELAELGVGAKPYLNIEGADAITDRSIHLSNIRPRMRNSVAVSSFDHQSSSVSSPRDLLKRRPNSLVSTASSSESTSSPHLINTLNLHLFSPDSSSFSFPSAQLSPPSAPAPFRSAPLRHCSGRAGVAPPQLTSLQEDESDLESDAPQTVRIKSYRQYETTV
ncbi:Oidioi.mRNA.OKI2018_I69.chr2.g5036.t1.cds [Oikopleura dioica]|uniref:Oidioi.mRNA.OKI2018_I69.chr2.g5036.t1.cds n=1 Tax=Oikopleura dioica TaxID=34765 RepID=A0ABN7SYZ3_OIKDI|nr:Oidioi.mRNA.OKI2018_I69.chr2.g5036.t1.cds [Oikopleura dioica]